MIVKIAILWCDFTILVYQVDSMVLLNRIYGFTILVVNTGVNKVVDIEPTICANIGVPTSKPIQDHDFNNLGKDA